MHSYNLEKVIYLVITTEVDKKNACKIANSLFLKELISCVSFQNIESHYLWEGDIKQSKEVQLIIKCKKENIKKVINQISESHSYELPEIIYFPVSASNDYYDWVNSF